MTPGEPKSRFPISHGSLNVFSMGVAALLTACTPHVDGNGGGSTSSSSSSDSSPGGNGSSSSTASSSNSGGGGSSQSSDSSSSSSGGGGSSSSGGGSSSTGGGGSSSSSAGPTTVTWTNVSTGITGGLVSAAAVIPGTSQILALTGTDAVPPGAPTGGYYKAAIFRSDDQGATWSQLNQGAGARDLDISPLGIRFETPEVFWLFGYYGGKDGGIYRTTDGGNTFATIAPPGVLKDEADDVSFDAASGTVLVAEHQRNQAVYKTTDSGVNWTNIGLTLPAEAAYSQYTFILDSSTYLVGASYPVYGLYGISGLGPLPGTYIPGIYRTTDGGITWTDVAPHTAVVREPLLLNGVLYWTFFNDNGVMLPQGDGGLLMSTDLGAHWTVLVANKLVATVQPLVLNDGQIATMNTSGHLALYNPATTAWTELSPAISLSSVFNITYDATHNAIYAWQWNGAILRGDLH